MGMVLGLAATDDETIAELLNDPPLIWKLLAPDDPGMYEQARGECESGRGFFSRLFRGSSKTNSSVGTEIPAPIEEIDLDKSWHGIHYLLTGTAWEGQPPLNFIVLGGEQVGGVEVGYGPARAFRSTLVREIASAISEISQDDLVKNYDTVRMKELDIYPNIWDDQEIGIEYCTEYFNELKSFISRTAEKSHGMVISLS